MPFTPTPVCRLGLTKRWRRVCFPRSPSVQCSSTTAGVGGVARGSRLFYLFSYFSTPLSLALGGHSIRWPIFILLSLLGDRSKSLGVSSSLWDHDLEGCQLSGGCRRRSHSPEAVILKRHIVFEEDTGARFPCTAHLLRTIFHSESFIHCPVWRVRCTSGLEVLLHHRTLDRRLCSHCPRPSLLLYFRC